VYANLSGKILKPRSGRLRGSLTLDSDIDGEEASVSLSAGAVNPKSGQAYGVFHEFHPKGKGPYMGNEYKALMSAGFSGLISRAVRTDNEFVFIETLKGLGWRQDAPKRVKAFVHIRAPI
jgi:hypothetical protein